MSTTPRHARKGREPVPALGFRRPADVNATSLS